jgi:hypothetical protein
VKLRGSYAGLGTRYRNQLRQLPKVLGGCSEEELVASSTWSSQSESIEFQNAFEMGEQHLDLVAQPAILRALV